jgi:hypothetical protein
VVDEGLVAGAEVVEARLAVGRGDEAVLGAAAMAGEADIALEAVARQRVPLARVPTYTVNEDAVRHAKRLIDARRYVLRSRWQNVQPRAREQNAFLKTHSWEEYAAWHLGLTEGAPEETKARYAFVYGDFRRLHRMGLIACHYRAAEWRHKEIELAAHELLQYLDRKSA